MMAALVETYPSAPSTERGRCIKLSGDPKTNSIAYSSGRLVVVQQIANPLHVLIYKGHSTNVTVARFSPNGELVASADKHGIVRIWDRLGNDHDQYDYRCYTFGGGIEDLQWSPDGEWLVLCGSKLWPFFICAYNWKLGKVISKFEGHNDRVLSCSFRPKPPHKLVTCGTDFLVNCYDWPQLSYVANPVHSGSVNCISYSPNGDKFISVGSDQKAFVYDGIGGHNVGELLTQGGHTGSIFSVSWSSDNKHILTVSADNSAKIWEIADERDGGTLKKTLICPGPDTTDDVLVGCLWLKDDIVLVSLGGLIRVFSATDLDKAPVLFYGHTTRVNALFCYIDCGRKLILSSSDDGTIIRWTQGLGYVGHIKKKDKTPISCFAAVQENIIVSGDDNKVNRIHLNYGYDCGEEEIICAPSQPIDLSIALQFHDLSLITTEFEAMILKGTKVLSTTLLNYSATASALAPNGGEVIIGDKHGKLHIYSVQADHTLSGELLLERHLGPISAVKYSPDGKFFASADTVCEAVVWDSTSRKEKLKNLFFHMSRVTCVAWSPDSKKFATGSMDRNIIVYELEKHRSSRVTIKGAHVLWVYALAFTDNDTLVSSGEDGCLRLWRITNQ